MTDYEKALQALGNATHVYCMRRNNGSTPEQVTEAFNSLLDAQNALWFIIENDVHNVLAEEAREENAGPEFPNGEFPFIG